MRQSSIIRCCACASLVVAGCTANASSDDACSDPALDAGAHGDPALDAGRADSFAILLYTFSNGYRHDSIPAGINAIRALGAANGFGVDVLGTALNAHASYCANRPAASDVGYFTSERLARYAAVVFLHTTTSADGALLDDAGKASLEAYVRGGGGFVGIHAAADAEYDWPFYRELVGASFLAHGPPVTATLHIEDVDHPATNGLPNPWSRYDEWFDFVPNPRSTAHVLISLDEATYPDNPAPMGDHPIAWCKTIGAGHSFYTGLGHAEEAFAEPFVRQHLLGGVLYAAGILAADCSLP